MRAMARWGSQKAAVQLRLDMVVGMHVTVTGNLDAETFVTRVGGIVVVVVLAACVYVIDRRVRTTHDLSLARPSAQRGRCVSLDLAKTRHINTGTHHHSSIITPESQSAPTYIA